MGLAGRTVIRMMGSLNKGASVGSVVKAQIVMDSVAAKASS